MDERLKEIVDNYDKLKIGIDDSFKFSCKQCGKCCINREDILLNPRDIFNMSKELKVSITDFIDVYCEKYIGSDSHMVIVRLKPRGSIKRCPLLKEQKCMAHKAKPTVCALYPLGRAFMFKENKSPDDFNVDDIEYIYNGEHCGDNESYTVREWLELFNIPTKDEFFVSWQKAILKVMNTISKIQAKPNTECILDILWTVIYVQLYLKYDTDKDFMEQFEKNKAELFKILDAVPYRN